MRISASLLLFTATLSTAMAVAQQQPDCLHPTLDFKPEQSVTLKTFIKWHPGTCPMVIETWRNGTDCRKIGVTDDKGWDPKKPRACVGGLQDIGVHSGEVTIEEIRGAQKGRVEIKIWVPNTGIYVSVFVNVQ